MTGVLGEAMAGLLRPEPTTNSQRQVSRKEATMARLNTLNLNFGPRTHEGAPARHISAALQLRRSVLACLLWENQFYEDGVEIAGRIAELVPKVAAAKVLCGAGALARLVRPGNVGF